MPIAAHAVLRDMTPATYDALREAADALQHPPDGALCHVVWWEGRDLHGVDVWEERAQFEAFMAERVAPAAAAAGLTTPPEVATYDAHEVFLSGRAVHAPTAPAPPLSDHVERLREGYAAFARGDVPTVLALLSEDVTWESPASLPFGGTFRGRSEVGGFFASLQEHMTELQVTPDRFVADGDLVVVLGRDTGRATSGESFDLTFTHTWTFRDGEIVGFVEHLDTAAMNAALAGRTIDLRDDARSSTTVS